MSIRQNVTILFALLALTITAVCWGTPVPAPTGEWSISIPEKEGMDSEKLARMLQTIKEQQLDVRSIVIVRHGRLVLETYAESFSRNVRQDLHTCTKSVISELVGIAVKEGAIKNVDQPITDFFPEIPTNEGMKTVTVKHLLTGTSGMEWHERPIGPVIGQLKASPDWVRFILDRPIEDPPGTVFSDNTGAAHLLAAIVNRGTGRPLLEFARERLFVPLGINDIEWERDPQGIPIGGWGLKMRPVDAAKLGYLCLRNGQWNGKEILPASWVEESIRKQMDTPLSTLGDSSGYGYLWWLCDFGGYSALSDQGQFIFVVPEKDLVVVFTGQLDNDFRMPRQWVKYFILPAVRSDRTLPPNSKAQANLKALINNPGF